MRSCNRFSWNCFGALLPQKRKVFHGYRPSANHESLEATEQRTSTRARPSSSSMSERTFFGFKSNRVRQAVFFPGRPPALLSPHSLTYRGVSQMSTPSSCMPLPPPGVPPRSLRHAYEHTVSSGKVSSRLDRLPLSSHPIRIFALGGPLFGI